jgi:hypothetical protein
MQVYKELLSSTHSPSSLALLLNIQVIMSQFLQTIMRNYGSLTMVGEIYIYIYICIYIYMMSCDSSVSTVLGYRPDDWGSRIQFLAGAGNFSLHHHVQNGSGAHPASYPMGTRGSFPGGKAAGA